MPTSEFDTDPWVEYARSLGLNVARARASAGLSQDRAAAMAGMSKYGLGLLEQGIQRPGKPLNPKLRTLIALSQVLRVELSDLVPPDPPDITAGR